MNNQDYYNVGSPEAPVMSSSSLKSLDPTQGGSIVKYLDFFAEKEEKKDSLSLERGKLIHKYIEKPDDFTVADFTKPTEMMAGLLEEVVRLSWEFKAGMFKPLDLDTTITSNLKTESAKAASIQATRAAFEKLGNFIGLSTDDVIRVSRTARAQKSAYKSRTEETLFTDIVEGKSEVEYMKFLLSTRDKIVLTVEEKEKVVGAISSLQTHPKVSALLGLNKDELNLSLLDDEVYTEVPVYWQENITVLGMDDKKVKISCKALIDKIRVNHKKKIIRTIDLKSTKSSLYAFQSAFEYYKYYRQMAYYQRALIFWFKAMFPELNIADYKPEVLMIPVETHGKYMTGVYDVDYQWQYKGKNEILALQKRYAWHEYNKEYRFSYEEKTNDGILKFNPPVAA